MDESTSEAPGGGAQGTQEGAGARARPMADSLNPQAGIHAIAADPRELEAALRAGGRTLRRFPYFEERYGERGRRFTASDSGWIASLPGRPQAAVDGEVLWLGTLLASRGMPRWLLEIHLRHVHDELAAAVPERSADYNALVRSADLLRDLRRRHISDDALEALSAAFAARVGPEWSAHLPEAGGLLAAAVADERDGISGAVTSLEPWLTDPERFPPAWAESVGATLERARAIAQSTAATQPPSAAD